VRSFRGGGGGRRGRKSEHSDRRLKYAAAAAAGLAVGAGMGVLAERHKWFGTKPEPPAGKTVKLKIDDKPVYKHERIDPDELWVHVVFLFGDSYPILHELPDKSDRYLTTTQLVEWSKVRPDTIVFTYPSDVKRDPRRAFELLMLDRGVFRGETVPSRGGGDRTVNALDYASVWKKKNQPPRSEITYTKQPSLVAKSYLETPPHHRRPQL